VSGDYGTSPVNRIILKPKVDQSSRS
jgi:hypothetical protein